MVLHNKSRIDVILVVGTGHGNTLLCIRVVHLSFTSKYFDGHLICGARDLPDPSLSFTSAIALSSTSRVARDGRPG